ncbi:MAG: hypothetical protein IJ558_12815 [Treponema sp.]|nr:hypothetical protein [Treponema sp.]
MSAQELKNFEAQLALLSYAERLAIIEYLAKTLKPAYDEEKEAVALGFSGGVEERRKVDEAIAEFERGEYDTYDSFDEFKAAMNADA